MGCVLSFNFDKFLIYLMNSVSQFKEREDLSNRLVEPRKAGDFIKPEATKP